MRLWDLNTETSSHVLPSHKGWVLCVEWEATERKLASGGRSLSRRIALVGMVSQNASTDRRPVERRWIMDNFPLLGTHSPVSRLFTFLVKR